jgi:hypothetical protein
LVWFAEVAGQGVLMGMRHDVRNRFSRDVVLLADPLRPAHLAPDRPAPDDGVRFDGRLELSHGAVHVTDTDYEDVAIELVVHAGPPPIVLLGGAELGGALCPWPEADVVEPDIVLVVRRGTEATLTRAGESRSCAVAPGRTGVGLRGRGAQSSVVSQLTIRR